MAQDQQGFDSPEPDLERTPTPLPLLGAVLRHKSLVALGVVAGLLLGTLYFVQTPRVYQSTAEVLVVKKRSDEVTGLDTRQSAIEDYVSTHQVLVRSPEIVNRAIRKHDLASLPSIAGVKDDPVDVIINSLTVSRNKGTTGNNNVLELSFRGKVPADCATVLDAVIESYKDFLDETYRNMSDDTLKLVTDARNLLEKDLAKKEEAYRVFRENENTPELGKGKDGTPIREDLLVGIDAKRSTLLLQEAQIQGHLEEVKTARKEHRNREAILAMIAEFKGKEKTDTTGKSEPLTLQDQIFPLLVEEQKLLENYGPNHPEVQSVRKRIEVARNFFTHPSAAYENTIVQAGLDPSAEDPVDFHIEYLEQKLAQVKNEERSLQELFDRQEKEAKELTKFVLEEERLRGDLARTQQLFDGIVKRLQDVSLVKNAGGYDAKTIAPPGVGKKVAPSGALVFPLAVFLGVLAGCGLAFLADVTDKGFRTSEEIRRRLGLPVVGQIPFLKPEEGALAKAAANGVAADPMLCTYYRPKSVEAEAYRGVRTSLYFSTHGAGNQVVQVTSANSGDGKTTLACNLAVSIAQSGKRVILVDADLRKPRVHKVFGLSARIGLASVIAGEAEVVEAVQESGIPGLWVLPCGPLPSNPAELLTLPGFKDLLACLRDTYDFVLVDSPPLLAVTDATVVAHHVGGVLLTLRITKNARPAAERAKEILNTLRTPVLGVVINDADRLAGSRRYGYGYADSYYYGYGNKDKSYYQDQDGPGASANGEGPPPPPAPENVQPDNQGLPR